MIGAYFIEQQRFAAAIWWAMIIQVLGASLSVADDLIAPPNAAPGAVAVDRRLLFLGYALACFSTIVKAFRPVLAAKLLSPVGGGPSPFTPLCMAWMDALGAIVVLLPLSLCLEGNAIASDLNHRGTTLSWVLALGSSLAS